VTRALIKGCVDCAAEGLPLTRKATPPGPRCATHKRARRGVVRERAWADRIKKLYGLLVEEYWKIFAHQGRHCAICQRATGGTKHLSVDHDHATGFVRGLLCTPCNKMLGHLRDDPAAFRRAADYLDDPPAFAIIGRRIAPIELEPPQPYVNRRPRK
jgi:hypothetical protein